MSVQMCQRLKNLFRCKRLFSWISVVQISCELSACLLLVLDGSVNLSVKESELGNVVKKNSLIESCWFVNDSAGNKEKSEDCLQKGI
jgi:hypothetical protein